jgi:hypothetical protein
MYVSRPFVIVRHTTETWRKQDTGGRGNYDDDDKGWVPAGGKEPADYSGEEGEEEEDNAQEEPGVPPPIEKPLEKDSNGALSSSGKKRVRENEPAEIEGREEKKLKLRNDFTL